jgi:hypothetical protein
MRHDGAGVGAGPRGGTGLFIPGRDLVLDVGGPLSA